MFAYLKIYDCVLVRLPVSLAFGAGGFAQLAVFIEELSEKVELLGEHRLFIWALLLIQGEPVPAGAIIKFGGLLLLYLRDIRAVKPYNLLYFLLSSLQQLDSLPSLCFAGVRAPFHRRVVLLGRAALLLGSVKHLVAGFLDHKNA